MKHLVLGLVLAVSGAAFADEQTCTVKGMSCEHCVGTVKTELCKGDKYTTCEVGVGSIHVVTKDKKTKVTPAMINEAIANTNYKVDKCVPGAPKAQDGKAS